METPSFTESIDGATATALLEEQERITQSAFWRQHEALHEARGEEATFTFSPLSSNSSHDDEETKQPLAQEPLYKEGTFTVGGCSCGFQVKSDNEGTLTGSTATQLQNNTFTINYSPTTNYSPQSSSTGMYRTTATMYK